MLGRRGNIFVIVYGYVSFCGLEMILRQMIGNTILLSFASDSQVEIAVLAVMAKSLHLATPPLYLYHVSLI